MNVFLYKKCFKRPMDVFLSLLALVVFSPILALLALLVRVKLGSPVLFKQERPGLNEKIFTLYKFRTMTDEKDREGIRGKSLPSVVRFSDFDRSDPVGEKQVA